MGGDRKINEIIKLSFVTTEIKAHQTTNTTPRRPNQINTKSKIRATQTAKTKMNTGLKLKPTDRDMISAIYCTLNKKFHEVFIVI